MALIVVTRLTVITVTMVLFGAPTAARAQAGTFKLAYYNIQSGKGEPALPGHPSTFIESSNCSLNAWGIGFVQRELAARIASDPAIVALGLGEAWICATPRNVLNTLGWKAASSSNNGVALLARHGFAGQEVWEKLDTTLNDNPMDTMWALRVPVCLDAACSRSLPVAVAHWFATGEFADRTQDLQAQQTVALMRELPPDQPHVLIGDLNAWESAAASVCGNVPLGPGLSRLRAAGYIDAWARLYPGAQGFTGMTNRAGCGKPAGSGWKRIDYAWSSPGLLPKSMTRFGVVAGGDEAPSDHYGIVAEYLIPSSTPDPPSPLPNGDLGANDVVIHLSAGARIAGDWRSIAEATAASGYAVESPDRGVPKRAAPLAEPADYIEATFDAFASTPYRLWLRGRATGDAWTNDSVFVQFSGSVSATGAPAWRISGTSATVVSIEECSGCGLSGWGWADNAYGSAGPVVYFAQTGRQTIRIQPREDGVILDQVLLSPAKYLVDPPGLSRNDATIYAITAPQVARLEIVRYASDGVPTGDWMQSTDPSAAEGVALANPDRGVLKLAAPLASPANYVEFKFEAEANRAYRIWLRGKADGDAWANDSVFVQFDRSVTESGTPAWRIGTTSATWVGIEDCSGCGLAGWGWQDNGYGLDKLGPPVYFESSGLQTMRIQQREDGVSFDQVVLSAADYLTTRPGVARLDGTLLTRR